MYPGSTPLAVCTACSLPLRPSGYCPNCSRYVCGRCGRLTSQAGGRCTDCAARAEYLRSRQEKSR